MKPEEMNKGRNALLAVFLGLAMPGLGQIYNGELVKGISYFIIMLSAFLIGARSTLLLPDGTLIVGAIATILAGIAVYAGSIIDAYRKASKSGAMYSLTAYNRWYFYLAVWLLGLIIGNATQGYVGNNWLEAFVIRTNSMAPAIVKGDRILADKTAYNRTPPRKGDIVIFIYPDDRSIKFIKRVEALPGETFVDTDGASKKIPHGYIYVLGDNRNNSQDSRHFGLIPLRDVIGKMRQKYYSSSGK